MQVLAAALLLSSLSADLRAATIQTYDGSLSMEAPDGWLARDPKEVGWGGTKPAPLLQVMDRSNKALERGENPHAMVLFDLNASLKNRGKTLKQAAHAGLALQKDVLKRDAKGVFPFELLGKHVKEAYLYQTGEKGLDDAVLHLDFKGRYLMATCSNEGFQDCVAILRTLKTTQKSADKQPGNKYP